MLDRHRVILEIIAGETIGTQEQLQQRLQESGYSCTQATISRDIRRLRITKTPVGDGTYRYAARPNRTDRTDAKLQTIFRESVVSVAAAQNMIVLKTLPGMAGAACSALDSMNLPNILGSLAGDDTAFLVIRDAAAAETLRAEIAAML